MAEKKLYLLILGRLVDPWKQPLIHGNNQIQLFQDPFVFLQIVYIHQKQRMKIKRQKIYWLHPHFNNFMGGHKYIVEVVTRLQKKYQGVLLLDAISPANTKRLKDKKIDYKVLSGLSTNSIIYWLFLPYYVRKTLTKVKKIIPKSSGII